jgi:ParB family transcriptional regulator, chromosome partitioning protein
MSRPGGLGRGLGALIPNAGPGTSGFLDLKLNSIVPNRRQPREDFDEAALEELAYSLRDIGMLQPVLVRPMGDSRYELVAGERRVRAARLAGLDTVPAIVRHTGDEQLLTEALVENLHRTDLNPLEEAAAYQQLLDDFGMTHEALAAKLGRSRSAITNALRLLTLPTDLQQKVAAGLLSAGHARALLGIDDPDTQRRAAGRVIAEGLSVRATEELARRLASPANGPQPGSALPRRTPYRHLEERLSDALATRVQIRGSARRGKVLIDYAGAADLERLVEIFAKGTGEALHSEPAVTA